MFYVVAVLCDIRLTRFIQLWCVISNDKRVSFLSFSYYTTESFAAWHIIITFITLSFCNYSVVLHSLSLPGRVTSTHIHNIFVQCRCFEALFSVSPPGTFAAVRIVLPVIVTTFYT